MAEIVKPRDASTILLLRDAKAAAEVEVFMMVRHYEIDFNSGALVFPGGSVDKGDNEIIANPSLYSGGEGMEAGSEKDPSPRHHSDDRSSCGNCPAPTRMRATAGAPERKAGCPLVG